MRLKNVKGQDEECRCQAENGSNRSNGIEFWEEEVEVVEHLRKVLLAGNVERMDGPAWTEDMQVLEFWREGLNGNPQKSLKKQKLKLIK